MSRNAAAAAVRSIAADAILSDWRGRSFARATAYWLAAVAVAAAVTGFARDPVIPPTEGHGALSLDLAVNSVFCGTNGRLSQVNGPAHLLSAHPQMVNVPLHDGLVKQFGSIESYCATVNTPYIHNENGMMLLARSALSRQPDASAAWIGRTLSALRLLIVMLCALVFLWCGASIAIVAAFIVVADVVLRRVGMALSLYPFLAVLPLAGAAFYGAALRLVPVWRPAAVGGVAIAAGWFTAWGFNIRSSYLPILLAPFVAWLIAVLSQRERRAAARARLALLALVPFIAGFVGYQLVVIRPLLPPAGETNQNYSYHSVAHSLVIGVATPVNPFAERLGIAWDDQIGFALARKVDPQVPYLGPGYERALFTYYARLWQQYPAEMLGLYMFKVRWTGRDIMLAIDGLPLPFRLREDRVRRLNAAVTGYVLFGTAIGALAFSVHHFLRTRSPLSFVFGGVSAGVVLILLESAIIMPTFVGMYHSYLLVFFTLAPALAVQAALDVAAALGARAQRPLRP